jgi:hypothetical protein
MLSELKLIKKQPKHLRKSFRNFLFVYILFLFLQISLWSICYYKSFGEKGEMFRLASTLTFIGLITTSIIGGVAIKCIKDFSTEIGKTKCD